MLENHDQRFVIKCFSVTLSGHTSLSCDLLSACWRHLTPELPPWKLCSYSHLQHSDALPSYRNQHDSACMSHRRRNHSHGFISIRLSLYSLADSGFDSFEPLVLLMHRMHSFLELCIGITTLGFGMVFMV